MPRQVKAPQKKNKSSKSKSESCKEKCKKLECAAKVDVDYDVFPEIACKEVDKKNGSVEFVLDITTVPHCKITQLKGQRFSDCKEQCRFKVDVDVDFKCKPRLVRQCDVPRATFDLKFNAKTKQRCVEENNKVN